MNNYSNMYDYMSNDFNDINRLYGLGMPNQMMMPKPTMPNQMMMPNSNMPADTKLKQKLAKQAGNNMNFNKCGYDQKGLKPNNLYDVYSGFIRGNMFPDIYNEFKINKPFEVEPINEQAEMLTYLDAYCFAAHDLNLFLDNHPDNREMIELFKEYTKKAQELTREYESKYGPLFVDASTTYPWAWNNSPWPWEQ